MPRRPSGDKEVQHGDLLRAIRRYGLLREMHPDEPCSGKAGGEKRLKKPFAALAAMGDEGIRTLTDTVPLFHALRDRPLSDELISL